MQIYYFTEKGQSNFGDDLNRWLWEEIAPGNWGESSDLGFAGIGTIIRQDLLPARSKWVVFSAGVGYGPAPRDFGSPRWKVVALRGPLTCRVLGYPSKIGVIDGAALLSSIPRLKPLAESARSGIAFMPHYESLRFGNWKEVCRQCGFQFLDPHARSEETVEQIRGSRLVLADAMHAAIVADSLRVPWIPLMTSPSINAFKWLDWTLAAGVPYRPMALPPSSAAESIRNSTLGWYGECYGTTTPSIESALNDYVSLCRRKEKWWWSTYAKYCRRVVSSAPRKALQAKCATYVTSRLDQAHIDLASTALTRAASTMSYLSEDITLSSRVIELRDRLDTLTRTPADELFSQSKTREIDLLPVV